MILVTGFEPFGEHPSNPSEDIAKAVDGRVVDGLGVRAAILPVHHSEAGRDTTLHAVAIAKRRTLVGFLHVPLSPTMVAASGLDQPSMDPAIGVRAVETALQVICRECASADPARGTARQF